MKKIKFFYIFVLMLCLAFTINTPVAAAYQEVYLVDRSGYLEPGQSIGSDGNLYLTKGRTVGIIVGVGVVSGEEGALGTVEFTMPPIYFEQVSATKGNTNTQLIYSGVLASEYTGGNTYVLQNVGNTRVAYTLAIIERW